MSVHLAAIQKAPEPIPDLRPPKGEIETNFPETVFFGSALLFSLVVLIIGRFFQVRRVGPAVATHSPLARFHVGLAAIASGSEDPLDASIRAVRRYLSDAFEIGTSGTTNEEIVAGFAAHPVSTEDSVQALHDFLIGSDLLRFSPVAGGPEEPLRRATEIVEQLESRRVAPSPSPVPVAA
jgi:hypothetical protein